MIYIICKIHTDTTMKLHVNAISTVVRFLGERKVTHITLIHTKLCDNPYKTLCAPSKCRTLKIPCLVIKFHLHVISIRIFSILVSHSSVIRLKCTKHWLVLCLNKIVFDQKISLLTSLYQRIFRVVIFSEKFSPITICINQFHNEELGITDNVSQTLTSKQKWYNEWQNK